MSNDGNPLGGATPHGYVPLSDTERDFLSRLIERQELLVEIEDWGYVHTPRVTLGEYRLIIDMTVQFQKPEIPMSVTALTLILKMRNGEVLYKERMPTIVAGEPFTIFAGLEASFQWQVGIVAINPELIRRYMPSAHGLTTASIDKDTGVASFTGNRRLDPKQRAFVRAVEEGLRKLGRRIN